MKKISFTILMSMCFIAVNAQIGVWTAKTSLSFARSTHVAFTLNGKGYICAGADASFANLKDLWQYDPSSNSWSQKADMPGDPRQELSAFVIGNYAYVGLGRYVSTGEQFYSFNRYDPSTNTWSAIADAPTQRYTSTGFSIDSIGYITCGIGAARYKDLYAYNPRTDAWSQKASLPSTALNRSFACVVSVNHKAYLMGGYEGNIMKDFYEYDPASDSWTQKADYPGGKRSNANGFALGKYVLMGLGKDSSTTNNKDWYYYNPANGTWTKIKDYPGDNIAGTATFVVNGRGYVCGGANAAQVVKDNVYELYASALNIENTVGNTKGNLKPFIGLGSGLLHCNSFGGKFEVSVYDISGKQVFTQMDYNVDGLEKTFDLSHLSRGLYVAYFSNAGMNKSLKIILE